MAKATKSTKTAKSRTTKRTVKKTGRPIPMTPKAGVTRDPMRRFGCGGKLVRR